MDTSKEYTWIPSENAWLCIEYLEPAHTEITRYLVYKDPTLIIPEDLTLLKNYLDNHYVKPNALPTYTRVTGTPATAPGQSLVDITGLVLPLLANSFYDFEARLSVSTSAVTTGTGYGVNFSAAGATIEAQIHGSLSATAGKSLRINTFNTSSQPYLTTSGQSGAIKINGIITTGANAGNLSVKHLKVTSGTSTVFINSILKVSKIA